MITILRWFLYEIISVDRFDIITPQGIGKGIKKEKILFWFGVYRMRVYQPGNRVSSCSLKRNIYISTFSKLYRELWYIVLKWQRKNGSCGHGSALRRRIACIKRRYQRRLTKAFSRKTPVTEYLVWFFCVFFSKAKSILRMGSCVRFCNISFLRTKCGEGSPGSVL